MENIKIKQELGIIGFGNFGQFMTKHLTNQFEISIYDTKQINQKILKNLNATQTTIENICKNKIIKTIK